jgi:hypothetical protein
VECCDFKRGSGGAVTEASLPGHFVAGTFRIGPVLSRTASLFARNFVTYLVVTAIAALPPLLVAILVPASPASLANPFQNVGVGAVTVFLTILLGVLSQAIVLYGALQDMSGRPVRLADCVTVGLRRFLPLIGLAICLGGAMVAYMVFLVLAVAGLIQMIPQSPVLVTLGVLLLFIPLPIFYLMWLVATPACVVERLGPFRSLGRSRALTKGHRWKLLGLLLAVLIPALIVAGVTGAVMASLGIGVNLLIGMFFDLTRSQSTISAQIVRLVWTAVWTAFYAILVAVAYHDLRVAKEGVATDQIAAVFE